VANDNLATKSNKLKRNLEVDNICNICGRVEEDSHHATIGCTKSRAMRYEMRKYWDIPNVSSFYFTGKDWLQNLLYKLNKRQRSQTLMLLWRCWHLRNDIVHDKGGETVARSVAFLLGYDKFLNEDHDHNNNSDHDLSTSLTDAICSNEMSNRTTKKDTPSWSPPERDKLKMNVDAGFSAATGEATAGFAIRDHRGSLVLAGSTILQSCKNAEEAEALAVWTGLDTAYKHNLNISVLESDNVAVVHALNCSLINASGHWHIYSNIKFLSTFFPDRRFSKVDRQWRSQDIKFV
jgi:ribonuclease HI